MTIKAIKARFTSGNDIPVQNATVPADEWRMAMAEIQVLKDEIIWNKMALENLEKHCDERVRNEVHMFMRCRELAGQVAQLQEQNTMLDAKLAEVEKDAFTKSAQICQDWIDDHSKADNCTYNDCDMVAAVTDVRDAILQLQQPTKGPT